MLVNIDQALYARYKKEGYRIKKCAEDPVKTIPQVLQLAYLDINHTIRGIESPSKAPPSSRQSFGSLKTCLPPRQLIRQRSISYTIGTANSA